MMLTQNLELQELRLQVIAQAIWGKLRARPSCLDTLVWVTVGTGGSPISFGLDPRCWHTLTPR